MENPLLLKLVDWIFQPQRKYSYENLKLEGYRLISGKEAQLVAGSLIVPEQSDAESQERKFGINPVRPYYDYYGGFDVIFLGFPCKVRFAIEYKFSERIRTEDSMARFGWLRLSTEQEGMLYPNLSSQKQLLLFLCRRLKKPRFYVTRVYHYMQFELYRILTKIIAEQVKETEVNCT